MNLQKMTLINLKQAYPEITLREVASLTGIDLTRVFRIFNKGHEMKLTEYQVLNNLIDQKSSSKSVVRIQRLINESVDVLNQNTIDDIFLLIERKIQTAKMKSNHLYQEENALCLMA